jgi:hypothetical protein
MLAQHPKSTIRDAFLRQRRCHAPSMLGDFVLFDDDFAYIRFFAAIASARHPRPALAT